MFFLIRAKSNQIYQDILIDLICRVEEKNQLGCLSYWFLKKFFNWRITALQCCVSFCCTTIRISHSCMDISCLLPLDSPSHPRPPTSHSSRSSQSTRLGFLCYTTAFHQLSRVHLAACTCQCYFPNSSHPLLPPPCPQVRSLHLWFSDFSMHEDALGSSLRHGLQALTPRVSDTILRGGV